MDNTGFLVEFLGTATLRVKTPGGRSLDFLVNLDLIMETCPIFALEFEECGPHRTPKHTVEASSELVVISFLRYIYLSDYMFSVNEEEPRPCQLMLHAELCRMAELYDLPPLQLQASMNLAVDLEMACYFPEPPAGLCQTIRFVYEHLASQAELIDSILHCVVNCFAYHNLSTNEEFKQLFSEHHQFNKDLSRINMQRGFEDAGATDIIRLPAENAPRPFGAADPFLMPNDYPYELWNQDHSAVESSVEDSSMSDGEPSMWQLSRRLAYRPRNPIEIKMERERRLKRMMDARTAAGDDSSTSASEAEGFTMVRRPKLAERAGMSGLSILNAASGMSSTGTNSIFPGNLEPSSGPETYGMVLVGDPFADPEGSSSSDEGDDFDAAMSSSAETIKPEAENGTSAQIGPIPNSTSAPESISMVYAEGDQPSNPFSEDELLEYDGSSDSDWTAV